MTEPVVGKHTLSHDPSDQAHGTYVQQFADVRLSHFADPAKTGFSTRRMLPWDKAEPSGKIPTALESMEVGCKGKDCTCSYGANSGNSAKPTHLVVRLCGFSKLEAQFFDFFGQQPDLIDIQAKLAVTMHAMLKTGEFFDRTVGSIRAELRIAFGI